MFEGIRHAARRGMLGIYIGLIRKTLEGSCWNVLESKLIV